MRDYSEAYMRRFREAHKTFHRELKELAARGIGVHSPEFRALQQRFTQVRKALANDLH